ncbi:MAG: hypothetical protein A3H67_03420 [Candidatus Buchananbacteria bacterium RIFCSPLOWO2_02_FULL_46_11b]|uniref:UDP-N-acetylglucosamine--N-acetylmuramyl-(pentapeptide) pyrophosphoryl-undecaprenol N-acetylglucosamine transferase n=1 Tax=Candidatus Buchananbacteria bacterium RIFCSPLOWO2_02_FULL_46_11b TaxID=1797548 RepID=A0A1G1Z0I8_9BACT|nr:MAG: hypothetical protein A3H67_03420 [Candidatus Buchananbacteria bacterium RIFCSPLOWO2_02_FULL_46_11b]
MKIILSGGGTLGSVSPLLAIFEEIKTRQPKAEFLWLGTRFGPESKLIAGCQIPLKKIFSGKWRRYFSLYNFIDPLLVIFGFFQSLRIILKFKPDWVVSAGGFVAVPAAFAAKVLNKKILIHQQDVLPGLANRIIAPWAKAITVSFEKSLNDFPRGKTILTGNPVRPDVLGGAKGEGLRAFGLQSDRPIVLVIGGGTGALDLNKLVLAALDELLGFCQIIHLTGGKAKAAAALPGYRPFEFLTDQLKNAYAAADLVVSRAGLGTLTELAVLKKPVLVIPLPGHQENNALEFFKKNAAALLFQKDLTAQKFAGAVKILLSDKAELENLSRNIAKIMPEGAAAKITDLIYAD